MLTREDRVWLATLAKIMMVGLGALIAPQRFRALQDDIYMQLDMHVANYKDKL